MGTALRRGEGGVALADDPLLYLERRKYLCALGDAIHGVDSARVVLAKALQRLDAQARGDVA